MDNKVLAERYLSELEGNIGEADHVKKVDDIGFVTQKHPTRLVLFFKKLIFKMTKWMILPNQNRQTHFNGKVVNSLNLLKDSVLETNEYIDQNCRHLEQNLEEMQTQMESQRKRIILLENKISTLYKENTYLKGRLNVSCDLSLLEDNPFDYFEFENKMRGKRETIKASQNPYVDYFKANYGAVVLDLGCGRGEFLELMYDHGISARGTDVYEPFYKYCSERGFDVENLDALTYLNKYPDASVGGIFMGQVVEHISSDYLIALVYLAYRKLKPGCYFILETPNPEKLATYRNFYLDSGHSTPVHYLYLKEVFEQAGYEHVERFDNPFADYPGKLEELKGEQIENLQEFNGGIRVANDLIFGCRDYTLIARK